MTWEQIAWAALGLLAVVAAICCDLVFDRIERRSE